MVYIILAQSTNEFPLDEASKVDRFEVGYLSSEFLWIFE